MPVACLPLALLFSDQCYAHFYTACVLISRQIWIFRSRFPHSGIVSAVALFACLMRAALALAEGLACEEIVPGECVGLVSIEKDPRAAEAARRLVNSSPWAHLIKVVEADALQWIRSQLTATRNISSGTVDSEGARLGTAPLQGSTLPDRGFDLIYLDAEKKKYAEYVETILDPQRPLLAPDGALLIDNTLWSTGHDGTRPLWWEDSVAEDPPRAKRYARIAESIKALRETLRNDTRISHVSSVCFIAGATYLTACIYPPSLVIVSLRPDERIQGLHMVYKQLWLLSGRRRFCLECLPNEYQKLKRRDLVGVLAGVAAGGRRSLHRDVGYPSVTWFAVTDSSRCDFICVIMQRPEGDNENISGCWVLILGASCQQCRFSASKRLSFTAYTASTLLCCSWKAKSF